MTFELTPLFVSLLLVSGLLAGIINTLAGGGSNLTLPALMIMGLPADVANATNRVGVMATSITAMTGFSRSGRLPVSDLGAILVPVMTGGVLGAVLAAFLPVWLLKPLLLGTMIGMSVIILVRPSTVIPEPGEPNRTLKPQSSAWWLLFVAGIYGGFVQAGVGFVLIAAIAGGLRYDLVRANALKVICAGAFTAVALIVFIWQDLVMWVPGLILAFGNMVGAWIGVKMALRVNQKFMKWFLLLMTVAASVAAMI